MLPPGYSFRKKRGRLDAGRLMRRVAFVGACWLYPSRVMGKDSTPARLAYRLFIGEVPEGWKVSRSCGDNLCVNPTHLELRGTA